MRWVNYSINISTHSCFNNSNMHRAAALYCQAQVSVKFHVTGGHMRVLGGTSGQSLMEIAKRHKIDIEAACDGTCACSTCHVYLKPEWYGKVLPPTEDEKDMLDLALELREGQSRLSCQICVTPELNGIEATLPEEKPLSLVT